MVEQYKVGTALVKTFSISGTTPNPAVSDISSLYNEINYYESIDSPAVTMTASIVDSTDLKSSLPIVGGEGIVYDFSDSLQESISITGAMRLFKLANRVRIKKGTEGYDIFCTTNEMMFDQYNTVQRKYGPKPTSDIVQDIF